MHAAAIAKMTEAEYLAYDLLHEGKHEFVNGEVIAMAGATLAHSTIQMNLGVALTTRLRKTPCRAHGSDLRVRIDETGLYAYPDMTIYRGKPEFAPTRPESLLNPRVILEILSDSTEDYDLGAKAAHYRKRSSVEAVVFVDSRRPRVQLQTRNPDGTWLLSEMTEGELRLAVIDVVLPLAEIYEGVESTA
jgi:Uma2 family endonuclease